MRKIAICIIIAVAAFWASQDGRNAPARPVEQAQPPRISDDARSLLDEAIAALEWCDAWSEDKHISERVKPVIAKLRAAHNG